MENKQRHFPISLPVILVFILAIIGFAYVKKNERIGVSRLEDNLQEINTSDMDIINWKTYTEPSSFDAKNSTFSIDNNSITLVDGTSRDSSGPTETITRYFGNEARGDLNGDSNEDIAFLVTQDRGGSGTFYYVVAALNTEDGYKTTNGVFIGDRIAPQTTNIISTGELQINFATRKTGEPMTTKPSVGTTLRLKIDPSQNQLTKLD